MAEVFEKDLFQRVDLSRTADREKIASPSLNFLQDSWRRLTKNKGAVFSLVIVLAIILLAILAPVIAPFDPLEQNVQFSNLPARIPGPFSGLRNGVDVYAQQGVPEGVNFYFGTDNLGRDLFSRVLYGTQTSLIIAFAAALFDITIGVTYGIISGWFGGRVDTVMQRFLEIISAIPNLIILVLMLLVMKPGLVSIIVAIGFTSWVTMARVVRAQTLKLKNLQYILNSRSLGQSFWKIAFKHLLPNMAGLIIIQTMFSIPSAIFFEAFLSFLGIGIPVPDASLGSLINGGYKTFRIYPNLMWFPSGVLCVLMICFNLLADGLRDAFDPKMKD